MLHLNASEVEFLGRMIERDVRFIVVGGHAVQFHGHVRIAKDLDIFFSTEGDNPARVLSALLATRISPDGWSVEALASPRARVTIRHLHTELLGHIEAVSFEEAYAEAVTTLEGGVKVLVISKAHLLRNKRALARPQDLDDVKALEADE